MSNFKILGSVKFLFHFDILTMSCYNYHFSFSYMFDLFLFSLLIFHNILYSPFHVLINVYIIVFSYYYYNIYNVYNMLFQECFPYTLWQNINKLTLDRSTLNAKPVTSVLAAQKHCRYMNEPTLEKSLISAKPVTSILAMQEIYGYMKRTTLE